MNRAFESGRLTITNKSFLVTGAMLNIYNLYKLCMLNLYQNNFEFVFT